MGGLDVSEGSRRTIFMTNTEWNVKFSYTQWGTKVENFKGQFSPFLSLLLKKWAWNQYLFDTLTHAYAQKKLLKMEISFT